MARLFRSCWVTLAVVCPLCTASLSEEDAPRPWNKHFKKKNETSIPVAKAPACVSEAIEFPEMTWQTCSLNTALRLQGEEGEEAMRKFEHVGCWKVLAYNTDHVMTSAVYHNQQDQRCFLQLSGFHANESNASQLTDALLWPPLQHWEICGYRLYAPFVRTLRKHVRLGNWSRMMEILGGAQSPCQGDITVGGLSLGGALAEMIAGCANRGRLDRLVEDKNKTMPTFKVGAVYTYSAQGASLDPITNALSEGKGRCFQGRRFYFKGDCAMAVNGYVGYRHAHVETVEIFRGLDGPTYRVYPCYSAAATRDDNHRMPPQLKHNLTHSLPLEMRKGKVPHDMHFHQEFLRWFYDAGVIGATLDFPVSHEPGKHGSVGSIPSANLTEADAEAESVA